MSLNNVESLRSLCNNLKDMCGLSFNQTKNFVDLIFDSIMHNVLIDICDNYEGTKIKYLNIEIPYIGCITVKIEDDEITDAEIDLEDKFKQSVVKVVNEYKSPLIERANSKLVERIKNKYKEQF